MSAPSYETMMNIYPPRTPETPKKTYTGSCHCGRFKFECNHPILEDGFEVISCNCSVCISKGLIMMYIFDPKKDFKMTSGSLSECHRYSFNRGVFIHLSCPDCATPVFCDEPYNILGINVRTIDGINEHLEQLTIRKFDGRKF